MINHGVVRAPSQMPTLLDTLRLRLGLNRAILLVIVWRIWSLASAPVTLFLVSRYFTSEAQGYFYTFNSILAIQLFIELGMTQSISSFASHESAGLTFGRRGKIEGDEASRSRLASIGRLAVRWYTVAALCFFIAAGFGGDVFLSMQESQHVLWRLPWWLLCGSAALGLLLTPAGALLEGCNQLGPLYQFRLLSSIAVTFISWAVIVTGGQLYTAFVISILPVIATAIYMMWRWGLFVQDILTSPLTTSVSWKEELFPFQWRMAVSNLCGYTGASLFTPFVFHYSGAKSAGEFGMTYQIVNAIGSLAMSWTSTKQPHFGALVKRQDYQTLDSVFARALGHAILVATFGAVGFLFLVSFFEAAFGIELRLMSLLPTVLLLVSALLNQIIFAQAFYLRAHKKEPFLFVSIVGSIVVVICLVIFVPKHGATGASITALVASLLTLPFASWVFFSMRKEWHAPMAQ